MIANEPVAMSTIPRPTGTMLVARLHGPRDVRLATEPVPPPGPGEVLLRVGAVGICGSDLHWYQDAQVGARRLEAPLVLGHEFAGTVVAAGPGVEGPRPGTRVAVEPAIHCGHCEWCEEGNQNLCPDVRFHGSAPLDGALREYMVVPAHNCLSLPAEMSMAEGALLEALAVAVHAVDLAHLRLANSVAVVGGGPIGLLVAQSARAAGALDVFVSEPIAARRAVAARLGCTAIDAGDDPVGAILDRTGGRGVDVAFECAGADETPRQSAAMCEPGGVVVVVGIPCDDRTAFVNAPVRNKGLSIRIQQRSRRATRRALALAARGRVELASLVTHRYPLAEADVAFAHAERRDDGAVKTIIEPFPD